MPKPILLAIDDDTSVLEAVVQDLRRHYGQNYRIVRAASGGAALDICRQLIWSARRRSPSSSPTSACRA
jgi:thioredoxin reductase (NADPH)